MPRRSYRYADRHIAGKLKKENEVNNNRSGKSLLGEVLHNNADAPRDTTPLDKDEFEQGSECLLAEMAEQPMRGHQCCSRGGCAECAVTTLDTKILCSNHFLSACYEILKRLDDRLRTTPRGVAELREAKRITDDCARGVLEVSLHAEGLNNLQKARLLDLLFWASDIVTGEPSRAVLPNMPPSAKARRDMR